MAKEKDKTGEGIEASAVTFSPEQLELVQKMIEASKNSGSSSRTTVSRYTDVRDSKKIETVNVSRFDGKWVLGFKDLNNDPYRKTPKYSENKFDVSRKLQDQPFVTLILAAGDEDEKSEKEVPLIDYMNNREKIACKVIEVKKKEIIDDKGLLGRQGASGLAGAIDEKGNLLQPVAVKAEVQRIEMTFLVEVPGFEKPVTFIEAFLA